MRIALVFEIEPDEYQDFLDRDDVEGNLYDWFFAEICQNHGFGFLSEIRKEQD